MAFLLIAFAIPVGLSILDQKEKYIVETKSLVMPEFTETEVDFTHKLARIVSVPFMASAIIDIDNDGQEELFVGGGVRQADGLFRFDGKKFNNISDSVGLVKSGGGATLGAAVLDVDANGYSDLLVTGKAGIWLYANHGGQLHGKKLKLTLPKDTFPLSISICDLNRDGHFDLFITGYKKRPFNFIWPRFKDTGGGRDALFLNNGDDSFTDITSSAGIAVEDNSLQGLFVDIDDDKHEDLVVVHETGQIRTWKNMGNLTFHMKPNPTSSIFSRPMGIGVGDYNNDGLVDFLLSTTGSTIPQILAKGDLREEQIFSSAWMMLRNRGQFQFENVAEKSKLADYEMGRGAIFEDINLDGREDLVVSQNHPTWPGHFMEKLRLSGRILLQRDGSEFVAVGGSQGGQSRHYGMTPLTADFNADGHPDLVHINLAGKTKVFLSKEGNNHWLKVKLPDILESLGAVVTVKTLGGKTFRKRFFTGFGLCGDPSHVLVFGLGRDKAIDVAVEYSNGKSQHQSGELFNTTVNVSQI